MNKTSIIDTAVLKEKVQEYAMKVGRICARPVKNFCIVSMVILFWVSLPISAQKEIKVSYPSKVCVGDIFNVSYFLETEGSESVLGSVGYQIYIKRSFNDLQLNKILIDINPWNDLKSVVNPIVLSVYYGIIWGITHFVIKLKIKDYSIKETLIEL